MSRKLSWALALHSMVATTANANVVPHLGKVELQERSNLIVVGRAEKLDRLAQGFPGRYQKIKVLRVMKGVYVSPTLDFLVETPISEQNPHCCEVGKKYRLYLEPTVDGGFASVSGFYGAVRMAD